MLRTPAWALVSVAVLSCQPADAPSLEVIATPRSIDGRGATTSIEVSAFARPDVPGTGSVRLSSPVGSFSTPVTVMLDATGKGSAPFTCTTASDARCSARVTITADWLFKEMTISSEVRVTISPTGGGSAGGSAGGAAGGGSAAGGSAAGGSAAGGSAAGGSAAGGSAAGGSAAGGSAAGGSAAGGSAAGGSAAGGSAAGGSAAGGSAAGGSAAGGSAAGGSAAGGSAAGGSAAGGSAAGGSAAGGSAAGGAAGGSVPINVRAPVINPAGLVAFGTLTNGQCEGAFAALDAGQTAYVGVPCGLDPTVAFLRPDGGFVYRHPTTSRVMAAVPDPMGTDGSTGWRYPASVDNDLDVTPACTGNPTRFVLRPNTGSVVARCSNGTWVEGSTAIPALAGLDVIAFATNGTALVTGTSGLQLISTAGNVTMMTAPFTPTTKMTRANAQGFLAVQTTPTCSLYQLTLSGTATKVGDYTTTSAIGTIPTFCNGRIDANGTLFFGTTSIGGSRIVHRPLDPGSMTWAFGTNTTATVWDFGPRLNLLLLDGNGIVTSP